MSIAPQALERSVLEGKEREELAVIAEAMGVKPASRASKASIIDQILRQAGIEVTPEERPRKARAPRTSARNGAAKAPADGAAVADAAPVDVVVAEPAGTDQAPAVEDAAQPVTATADAPSSADDGAATAVDESSKGDGASGTDAATATESATESASAAAEAPANGSAATTEDAPPAAPSGAPVAAGPAPTTDRGPRPDDRQRDRDRDRGQRDNAQRDNTQRDNTQRSPQGDNSGEPGNRRSRRRRGRDRGERDIQGGGQGQERSGQGQQEVAYSGEPIPAEGLLDLRDEGYGFLRTNGYLAGPKDVYVSLSQVRRFGLRKGDEVKGASRPAGSTEKYPALLRIDTVNDMSVDDARNRPRFEDLTPLFPDEKLRLEIPGDSNNMVARIVDLISPIGKGQRGLIVSPPKAGKTTVLKQIAHSIEANNPDVHLMVLLVDERPEEVTDMRRSVKGEVIASTFDRPSDEHTQVAELASERARRLVEMGRDVVIVLDGITRLARAYNLAAPASGRIMSGGLATDALYPPKKFFGSARNLEEGGSLTILATALIETGSKMDEVIFEEFKGTGNMELRLDRKLAERRIYPALEVNASSTRHEELLFERGQLQQVWKLRRVLNALEGGAGLELLMDKIKTTKSNDEFLAEIAKAPSPAA
ncbi:MAG: transcription termination factor Rho [Actinomycetota bacterium]|nr:transcription termination factor Rho [Actinomycetota bacterium]